VRQNGAQGSAMTTTAKHREKNRNGGLRAACSGYLPAEHLRSASIVPEDGNGDVIDQTVAVWQKHTKRELSREDGREIIENMTGFFQVLRDWDNAERKAKGKAK